MTDPRVMTAEVGGGRVEGVDRVEKLDGGPVEGKNRMKVGGRVSGKDGQDVESG